MTASLVQLIVPDHLRGRVMSIYMVAFRGGMPLGSLAGGYAATLTLGAVRAGDQRRAGARSWRCISWSGATGSESCEFLGQPLVHGACGAAGLRPRTTRRHDETTKIFVSLFDGLVSAGGDRASRGRRSEGGADRK